MTRGLRSPAGVRLLPRHATARLNLTRVNYFLHWTRSFRGANRSARGGNFGHKCARLNPEVFISNVLMAYLASAMEDYFKSSYIAAPYLCRAEAGYPKGHSLVGRAARTKSRQVR